jgi:hypothetical protein
MSPFNTLILHNEKQSARISYHNVGGWGIDTRMMMDE